jgi:hypothetical protein
MTLSQMVPHHFVVFPQFRLKKGDFDGFAFKRKALVSSDQDLVEEFIAMDGLLGRLFEGLCR